MIDTLILGSNSFSGSHLAAHSLKAGMRVAGISRSPEPDPVFLPYKKISSGNWQFYQLDLNKNFHKISSLIHKLRPRFIANFAAQGMVAQSWDNPDHWIQTNVTANAKLVKFLCTCDFIQSFVQASTPEIYGSCTGNINESATYNPSTPYAVSKAAADMCLHAYHKQFGFPVIFTRAANVYGAGQKLYRIIPRTVMSILLGCKLPLHGGGTSVRSFINISDVANAVLTLFEKGRSGEVYHLSTDRCVTIAELVHIICEKMGVSFEKTVQIVGERTGNDSTYMLQSIKARSELGWSDKVVLESGIDEVIKWTKTNFNFLKTQPMEYIHLP